MTHQGAAHNVASIHFGQTINRTDILTKMWHRAAAVVHCDTARRAVSTTRKLGDSLSATYREWQRGSSDIRSATVQTSTNNPAAGCWRWRRTSHWSRPVRRTVLPLYWTVQRWRATTTTGQLLPTNHISETARARVVKFCTHVGYVKSQHKNDKSPLKDEWSRSHFKFRRPQWYLWNG